MRGASQLASLWLGVALCALPLSRCAAQDSQTLLSTMLARENDASVHRGRYMYLNEERSERTGQHLWLERVAETDWGKVRLLLQEDGKPIAADRTASERGRLADEAAHPDAFRKAETSRIDGEQHARDMLRLLPRAFIMDQPVLEGDAFRINYRPNPDFQPASMEEKVLHAMSGSVLIDTKMLRMREVNGHTSQDVSVGFGMASVKAGSNFNSARIPADGQDWKLLTIHADIRGKAFFLKIAKTQDAKHGEFKRIPDGLTVAAAVELVENTK